MGRRKKGLTMDEAKVREYAGKGLPDKAIAVLMDCGVDLFGKWPHLRKAIDQERAKLQLELAGTFVAAAKGRAAVPPTEVGGKDGQPEVPPDMKAGGVLLDRLGFFEEPLDRELVVKVEWDEEAPVAIDEDKTAKRKPVDIKRMVGAAVAVATAARIADGKAGRRKLGDVDA